MCSIYFKSIIVIYVRLPSTHCDSGWEALNGWEAVLQPPLMVKEPFLANNITTNNARINHANTTIMIRMLLLTAEGLGTGKMREAGQCSHAAAHPVSMSCWGPTPEHTRFHEIRSNVFCPHPHLIT